MSAISRKTIRTSTTIFEYPEPSRARNLVDGCITTAIIVMFTLIGATIGFLAFNMW